jgi:uncharacterized protein (DUF1778 family)
MGDKMDKRSNRKVIEKGKKARITLECSPDIRRSIKIRAAQKDISMNDYLLSIVLESSMKDKQ